MAALADTATGPRILVVEDTFMLAQVLAEQLEDSGYQVVGPVGQLARGMALASTETIDGALLDVNLNGERCFPIAELLSTRHIPFAFLTGYGDAAIDPRFSEIPCLTKPYTTDDLTALLDRYFGPQP